MVLRETDVILSMTIIMRMPIKDDRPCANAKP